MLAEIGLFILGLVLLTTGADALVRGASRLAAHFGMNPLVVGLTVVAFGTSAPELVVSGAAALREQPGLAVGNVMGSTVANVGLIVGLGALVRPIRVQTRLLALESPLLILVMATVILLSLNDALGRLDGFFLVTGFLIYLTFLLRWAHREGKGRNAATRADTGAQQESTSESSPSVGAVRAEGISSGKSSWTDWLRIALGLGALLVGADWLLDSAVVIARHFHVPEAVIGATLVAVGTSLPELASTVAAAARRLGDIAIGNIIGSNVFNLGLVLGSASLLKPLHLPPETVIRQVLPALFFSLLLIPLALTGRRVNRREGALLLVLYAGFIRWML
ncbi:MAG: calcium/sodium antiporter [Gemmatimonadota bacterium]